MKRLLNKILKNEDKEGFNRFVFRMSKNWDFEWKILSSTKTSPIVCEKFQMV